MDTRPPLYPHLPDLAKRLRSSWPIKGEKHSAEESDLEFFPHCMWAARHWAREVIRVAAGLEHLRDPESDADQGAAWVQVLRSEETDPMVFAADAYLAAARRAQNALMLYVGLALDKRYTLPTSLHDVVKDTEKKKVKLPHWLAELLVRYWGSTGQRLKQFRDQADHFFVVSTEVQLARFPNKELIGIRWLLPDSPEVIKAERVSYIRENHSVIGFVLESYLELFSLGFCVTRRLLDESERPDAEAAVRFLVKGGVVPTSMVGIPGPDALEKSLANLSVELEMNPAFRELRMNVQGRGPETPLPGAGPVTFVMPN